jgi:hypothetical protein
MALAKTFIPGKSTVSLKTVKNEYEKQTIDVAYKRYK